MPVRKLLELYLETSLLEPEAQAATLAAMRSEDERQLLKYALSAPGIDDLVELIDGLEARAAAAAPEPPSVKPSEFAKLHAAFGAVPAQLHHALLMRLGGVREALALALLSLPTDDAADAAPHLLPLLLAPAADQAAAMAEAAMGSAEAVGAAIAAFDALSLASRAALVMEVAEKEATLGSLLHLLSAKALTPQALPPVVAGLRAVGAGKAPPQESVAPLHAALSGLPTQTLTKVVALAADAGPLLEATPYMEAAQWAELVASCCQNDRLVVDARRVARSLIRSEATHLRHWIVHNPEERALLGFFAGWFVFLISLFGILEELLTLNLLELMIDLYIAVLAGLACVLEVKSTLLRDHLTLFLERHCALLRFASGRGCVYFATGFLAFDVHEKAQLLGGGMMLVVGLVNVGLGTWVAPKLKRLRRSVADEAALLSKFRMVESAQPEGLSAKEMHAFCAACGVRFNRLEMQAVFLELDAHRDGLVSQSELLTWYHGHVHPFLKKLANTKPPQPRRLLGWLRSGRHVLLELPLYASLAARLLLPFSVAGMLGAVLGSRRALVALSPDPASGDLRLKCTVYDEWVDAQDQCLTVPSGFDCCTTDRSFVQLVINFFLLLCALLTWAVETRSEGYRRTALHVLRYASLLLHHTARGALYLLVSLALLPQRPVLSGLAYVFNVLGLLHVLMGLRVSRTLGRLRKKLRTAAAARAAFAEVAHGRPAIGLFQLKLLLQTHGVPPGLLAEQVGLLTTLDLDRTGTVSEAEFLFWLCDGSDAEGLQPGEPAAASGGDAAEWLGSRPAAAPAGALAEVAPVAPLAEAAEEGGAEGGGEAPSKDKEGGSWQDV